jgi:hypothetical protein
MAVTSTAMTTGGYAAVQHDGTHPESEPNLCFTDGAEALLASGGMRTIEAEPAWPAFFVSYSQHV